MIPPASREADLPSRIRARIIVGRLATGWIMEKFARRLVEHLPVFGVDAEIGTEPSTQTEVNHWILYHEVIGPKHGITSVLITHVDDPLKRSLLKRDLEKHADVGICQSRDTLEQLVAAGIPARRLCFMTPAHDGLVQPRRLVIGMTSRLYPDMRKREHLLLDLGAAMRLDDFHFVFYGSGWERIVSSLERAGATVDHHVDTGDYARDYAAIVRAIPHFDYFLYTGMDEGSLGLMDALAAGVPTIATPQGFHLDLPGALTHAFHTRDDLVAVFTRIAAVRRERIDGVKSLTWARYAETHASLWRTLRRGGTALEFDTEYRRAHPALSLSGVAGSVAAARATSRLSFYGGLRDPKRWRLYLGRRYPRLARWWRDRVRRRGP